MLNHNTITTSHTTSNTHYRQNLFTDVASGQLTLDKLLASLALEADVNDQHLANIDNNNLDLSAIIADLTEFSHQCHQDQDQWPIKGPPGFFRARLKKLTESDECSSSSLSERSNDQVA